MPGFFDLGPEAADHPLRPRPSVNEDGLGQFAVGDPGNDIVIDFGSDDVTAQARGNFSDGWNADEAPNPGPYTSAGGIQYAKGQAPVIGDPNFDWDKGVLNVDIPKNENVAPATCWDRCKEEDKLHRANCAKLRKRVELLLRNAGCPSKIVPLKGRCYC